MICVQYLKSKVGKGEVSVHLLTDFLAVGCVPTCVYAHACVAECFTQSQCLTLHSVANNITTNWISYKQKSFILAHVSGRSQVEGPHLVMAALLTVSRQETEHECLSLLKATIIQSWGLGASWLLISSQRALSSKHSS